ncbi:MAG TPA: hypothetical protein GXX29_14205 [Firmicutes bacterium]|nr:hypothetical protein [Bacillota bacterium]
MGSDSPVPAGFAGFFSTPGTAWTSWPFVALLSHGPGSRAIYLPENAAWAVEK